MIQRVPDDILKEISSFLGNHEELKREIEAMALALCVTAVKLAKNPRKRTSRWMARGVMYAVTQLTRQVDPSPHVIDAILMSRRIVD